jgi:hypothetical protein
MPEFKYGNGSATMTSVFSLDTGKHLSDVLSPYGPLDWGMTIGTTYYDFSTLASFSTSLPRVFADEVTNETHHLIENRNCFEVTSAYIMSKISSFYHLAITKKTNPNVPSSSMLANSEWFNFEAAESEENILNILAIVHDYAQRVFTGRRPDREVDLSVKDAFPYQAVSIEPTITEQDKLALDLIYEVAGVNVDRIEADLDLADLSNYVLVLSNSLRLLKMLVCKQASLPTQELPEVRPVFRNLERLL